MKSQNKIQELHNVQCVHVLISSYFKSSFLMALLNESNNAGELLISDYILLQSEGPRYLSECVSKVTIVYVPGHFSRLSMLDTW